MSVGIILDGEVVAGLVFLAESLIGDGVVFVILRAIVEGVPALLAIEANAREVVATLRCRAGPPDERSR